VAGLGVDLAWTDPTPAAAPATLGNPANEVGFRVERATITGGVPGAFAVIRNALANQTAYRDTSAAAGVTYRYRVIIWNVAGTAASNTVDAVGTAPVPGVPVLTSPANGATIATQTPTLQWNASANATTYNVQVSTSPVFTTLLVNQTGIVATTFMCPPAS